MKKKLVILAVIILALLVVGVIKDQIIKGVVTVAASRITGAPVKIDGFSLGVITQSVRISGLKIYNPEGFSKSILIDLSKINVKYDLGALLKKKLHLINAEIEIKEMGLERNKEGKMNVDGLKIAKQGEKKDGKPAEQMPMQIDIFKLGIGKIVLRDYSSGKEPILNAYEINIHKTYKDITSAQQLAALIMTEPMKAAGIQGAKIYGVAALAGAAILPVGIAATFAGKDSAKQEFAAGFDDAYAAALAVMQKKGNVTAEDKASGIIKAEVNSAGVALKINKISANKTEIVASARKMLLPKPEIAAGVIYEISEKLKAKNRR